MNASEGGTVSPATSTVTYPSGRVISISATPNSNYEFVSWTSDKGGTFANANSASTTFTMPAANVKVTANFKKKAAPTYTISVNPTTLDFGTITEGDALPSAQTVTVKNTGNQTATLKQPTLTGYTIGALSTETLAPNASATFTVKPTAELSVGNHNATLTISTTNNTSATVGVKFAVKDKPVDPTYTISVNPTTLDFGTITEGDTMPSAQTVTVKNTGNQTATLKQPTLTGYTIGTLSATEIGAGKTATFTVKPNTGLSVGNHNATLTISTTKDTSATVGMKFAVKDKPVDPTYTISVNPTTLDFGTITEGNALPGAQTVTVKNTGNQTVTLNQPTSTDYTVGALSATELEAGKTATFTVAPNTGLSVGNHTAALTISTTKDTSATVGVRFTVQAKPVVPTYTISVSPTGLNFGTITEGDALPSAQTITVKNTGNQTVTLKQPTSTDYTIGTLSATELEAGKTATFTVAPNTGLSVGNHTATLTISTTKDTSATVDVQITVQAKPVDPTYTISVNPTGLNFGTVTEGDALPSAQTITVTNTGNQTVTLKQPTSTDYTIGTLSATELEAGKTATFTVVPKAGLSVGNHTATLTISTTKDTSATVGVQFAVQAKPTQTGIAPTILTETLPDATLNRSYSQKLVASGDEPIRWSITAGSLPDGLTLASDGTISGTPSKAGAFAFTVCASNGVQPDAARQMYLLVKAEESAAAEPPQTGDHTPLLALTMLALGSLTGMLMLKPKRKH